MYHDHKLCRVCQCSSRLVEVADFGATPLANDFREPGDVRSGYAPLKLIYCEECNLPQLSVVVDPAVLYANYPYVHSDSEALRAHFKWLTSLLLQQRPELGSVMEFGSNDGLFLSLLKPLPGVQAVFGIDPCQKLVGAAQQRGVASHCALFDEKLAEGIRDPFDTVIGRHVFAHIDDWHGTIRALSRVTHKDSVVVLEMQYAGDMLAGVEWDTIYHEHLSYVTIRSLLALLQRSPFYLHDVKHVAWMGGSLVAVLRRRDSGLSASPDVAALARAESGGAEAWQAFRNDAWDSIARLRETVNAIRADNEVVWGYGAPAKAANWIHQCRFTSKDLTYVTDTTPAKQRKLVPGSDIPVISPDFIRQFRIDYLLLFIWNLEQDVLKKEADYLSRGGKFIVPLPRLHTVPLAKDGATG